MALKLLSLALALLNLCLASATLPRRAPCVPQPNLNTTADDAPAINAAILACGNGGTIRLPANNTYHIRTPITFTGCNGCDFQLEGTLDTGNNSHIWWNKPAIISMAGVKGAKFRSLTSKGVIEGSGVDYYKRDRWSYGDEDSWKTYNPIPILHYVTNGSMDVLVANITVNNAIKNAFQVDGNSSSVRYEGLSLNVRNAFWESEWNQMENNGIVIGPSSHITITSLRANFQDTNGAVAGNCVIIDFGSTAITVSDIHCTGQTGVILRDPLYPKTFTTVRDVHVSNVVANTSVAAAIYSDMVYNATIHNVTWDNVQVLSGRGVDLNLCYETPAIYTARCNIIRDAEYANISNVWFKGFSNGGSGKGIGQPSVGCWGLSHSHCEVGFVNWNNGTAALNATVVSGGA